MRKQDRVPNSNNNTPQKMFAKTVKKSTHKSQFWYDKSWEYCIYWHREVEACLIVWMCAFLCVCAYVTERETC